MIILHVARIRRYSFSGVCVAVPQHIIAQSRVADVYFINIEGEEIPGIPNQLPYTKDGILDLLDSISHIDIAIFHEVYIKDYVYISYVLKKRNIPYIIVPHGSLVTEAQNHKFLKKWIANRTYFARFFKDAAYFQCLSRNEAENLVLNARIFISPNGVELPVVRKNDFSKNQLKFTFIGRLDPYTKGLDLLISAIEKVSSQLRTSCCSFDIYGPHTFGWDLEILNLIEDHKVQDLVFLKDKIEGNEKKDVLLATDVFIQTSRHEGLPMGILEALSYGLPVLITKETSLGSIVDDYSAGFTCDASIDSIANCLIEVIEHKDRLKEMSRNAFNLVSDNYVWDNVAKSAVAKFEEIISGNHLS